MSEWSKSEIDRRKEIEAGRAVVANRKTDRNLIAWAKEQGLYVYIGRPGPWGNPFAIGEHGDRGECIAKFRNYLETNTSLKTDLDSLRGKVLGCFCHPESCHGEVLLSFL